MKKFMIFSLLAALACGAWADETYGTYDVSVIDISDKSHHYTHVDGTIPYKVTVQLVDTGYDIARLIYSQEVDFSKLTVLTAHGETVKLGDTDYVKDGRFNVASFYAYYEGGNAEIGDNATLSIFETKDWGISVGLKDTTLKLSEVYANAGEDPLDWPDYGDKYLKTYLLVGEGDDVQRYTLGIDTTGETDVLNSVSALGVIKPEPVPEPTSGLLLLMGLAGLALKRKQQAK